MSADSKHNAWDPRLKRRRSHARFLLNPLLWLGFGLLYAGTTALDVLPADAGEFQLVAAEWGIAHPPGYPLYSLLAWLWTHLVPVGSAPFRTNLFSALIAATALWLIWRSVTVWAESREYSGAAARFGGLVAALALGSATTFWHQATTANIRMPTVLFTAWGFLALARYEQAAPNSKDRQRALHTLALATGLGIGHHPSLAFVAVGWLLGLILDRPRLVIEPRRWWRAACLTLAAWLVPQLLLPLRDGMANVPLAPGDLDTWQGFWGHVLARGFGGDMFAYATLADLSLRMPLLPTLFRMQFPDPVLLVIIGGWLWLLIAHRRLAAVLLTTWLIHTFVTITYRAPQTVEYLMPAYVPMVIALGMPVAGIGDRALRSNRQGIRGLWRTSRPVAVGLLLLHLLSRVDDFAALSTDRSVRERTEPLLEHAAPGALILADWRWATPLWTLQRVEGQGPDVEVTYVVPNEGVGYEDVWRQRAEEAEERHLYATHRYHWNEWAFTPVGGGYRLTRRPALALPDDFEMEPLEAQFESLQLLGYRWLGDPTPGKTIELHVAWQATDPRQPEPSFTTRLWDREETLLAAKDLSLGVALVSGEVRVTPLPLQLPLDRCDDLVYPTLGAYTVQDGGYQDLGSTSLPPLPIDCTYPKLPVRRPWPGWVASRGPFLRGIDYDARSEASALAFLHWCGPGAALTVTAGDQSRGVGPLSPGACQTTILPIPIGQTPRFQLAYLDDQPASLLSPPLPVPDDNNRYLPFGDQAVLIKSDLTTRGETTLLDLTWLTTTPIEEDYAISVRLHDETGAWIGMHDMQPGLGAIPTLKWVARRLTIRDPHPFDLEGRSPAYASTVVYERFRLTSLSSTVGEISTLQLSTP